LGIEKKKLENFAVVELMGRTTLVGLVTESDISGSQLLRLDVIDGEGKPTHTKYIGVGSIYALTIVDEAAALAVAGRNSSRPTWAWGLPQPASRQLEPGDESAIEVDNDFDDEEEEEYPW